MSLTRFVLPSLVLGLVLSLAPSVATAGVVFGNLGAAGTDSVASLDVLGPITATSASTRGIAQAFNTGAATFGALKLNSVTLGLSAVSTRNATVTIYKDSIAPGNVVGSATAAVTGNTDYVSSLVDFSFNVNPQDGLQLLANTTYYVAVDATDSAGVAWADTTASPVAYNSSTYTFSGLDALRKNSTGNWVVPSVNSNGAAFSVNAVPEPSTYAMAGIGAGLLGLAKFRRRLGRTATQG